MPESVKIPVQLIGLEGVAAKIAREQEQFYALANKSLQQFTKGKITPYSYPRETLTYPETKIPVMMETATGRALSLEEARRVRAEVRKRVEASAIPAELKESQISRELASKYTTFKVEHRERIDRDLETRMFKINNDKIKLAEEELQRLRGMTFKSTSQEEQIRQQKIKALQQELDAIKARPKTDPTAIAAKKQQILQEIYPNDLERANQRRQQAQKRLFEAEEKLFSGYGTLSVEEATNLRKRITHESRILQDPDYLNRTLERGRRKKLDRLQQELQVLESGGFYAGTKEEEENRRRKIANIMKERSDLEKEGLTQTRRTESVKRAASASQGIEEYIKELEIEMAYAKERPKTGFLGFGGGVEDQRRQREFVRLQGEINRVKGLKPAAGATYQDILQWKEEYNVAHREWFNFKRSMDVYDNLRREQDRRRSGMTMGLASAGIGLFGSAGFPLLNIAFASMSGMPYAGIAAIATAAGEAARALNRFTDAAKKRAEELHFYPKGVGEVEARWKAMLSIPGAFQKEVEKQSTKEAMEKIDIKQLIGPFSGWEGIKAEILQKILNIPQEAQKPVSPIKTLIDPFSNLIQSLLPTSVKTAIEVQKDAKSQIEFIAGYRERINKVVGDPRERIRVAQESYERARRFLMPYQPKWEGMEEPWRRIQRAALAPPDEEMKIKREELDQLKKEVDTIVKQAEEQIKNTEALKENTRALQKQEEQRRKEEMEGREKRLRFPGFPAFG